MFDSEDLSFLSCEDPDDLSPEDRDKYLWYWAARTPNERLEEAFRLNRIKWGDEVFERGVYKTVWEVVDRDTGEVRSL